MGHIRFTLALLVLISHAGLATDSLSRVAVSCFFILSGYLMQLTLTYNYVPFTPKTIYRYFSNRFLRIFPLYWACILVIAITNFGYFEAKTSGNWIGSLIPDHRISGNVIGPAWTLPYEITYFLFAPLFALLSLRWQLIISAVATFTFMDWRFSDIWLLQRPFALGLSGSSITAQAIMLFTVGALVYKAQSHFTLRHFGLSFNIITISFYLFVCVAILSNWTLGRSESFLFWEKNAQITNAIACLVLILALLLWSHTESPRSSLVGRLTYPIYLIHWPLLQVFLPQTAFASYLRKVANYFYLADYLLLTLVVFLVSVSAGLVWLQIENKFFTAKH